MDDQPQPPIPNGPTDNNGSYPPNPPANPSQQPVSQPGNIPIPNQSQPTVYAPTNQPQPTTPPGVVVGSTPSPFSNPTSVAPPAPYQNQSTSPATGSTQGYTQRKSKKPLLVIGLVIILVLVGGGAYALLGHKTSYQSVIQKFITAVQNKDKATADSLESPAMKSFGQKNVGTASFYDACQQASQLCMPLFSSSFLDKATKTYKNYTASNGTKGKEVVYSLKQTLSGTQAGGQGCSSSSTNTLTIAVVPKGNSWLIDDADPTIDASGNLCAAPGGTSSVGNQ